MDRVENVGGALQIDEVQVFSPDGYLHQFQERRLPVSELPWWKQAFDLAFSVSLTVLLAPLFLIIAAAILISDGRPVFFEQQRIGIHGRRFRCFKFRTMVKDADARLNKLLAGSEDRRKEWQETQKLKDDPRVLRIGRLLRRTSLDEIPQLLNVLRGDMSVVGPRPIVESEIVRYGAGFDAYTKVRPGITGLWQVSGRNEVSYPERVAMDVRYVEKLSPLADIRIVLKTALIVFAGKGDHVSGEKRANRDCPKGTAE